MKLAGRLRGMRHYRGGMTHVTELAGTWQERVLWPIRSAGASPLGRLPVRNLFDPVHGFVRQVEASRSVLADPPVISRQHTADARDSSVTEAGTASPLLATSQSRVSFDNRLGRSERTVVISRYITAPWSRSHHEAVFLGSVDELRL